MSNIHNIMIIIPKVIVVIRHALCIAFKNLSMSFIALIFEFCVAKIDKISIRQIKMSKNRRFYVGGTSLVLLCVSDTTRLARKCHPRCGREPVER